MEKELLQKALDSILHGSTQIVSEIDTYGNLQHREVHINDLRVPLVDKLADKLVNTDGFKNALEKALTKEVTDKIITKMMDNLKWSDLPYRLRDQIEKQMTLENTEFRKLKLVVDTTEKE